MNVKPFCQDSELTNYYPLPREVLQMELCSTALMLYGVLLDRGTLSRKNHYADEAGWVYVIYPIENLAKTLGVCPSMVKKHLKKLEKLGLIRRRRPTGNGVSHIYLCVPEESIKAPPGETKAAPTGESLTHPRGKKVPTNNIRKQQDVSNYYQQPCEESL